ncbi:RNA-binding ribosome assembly factor RBP95 ASCRUDRAFT_35890 [Ascoidea rubescens DSM 1968]|uniref:WKF domain-containing protein n=1 Tax=Ascoidea rubescens DSM 1968 TaxID=1344418 RepID=A0A1D2VFT5_9ASCO|nr:hypothetical protein ASCRUDRAFT_35890 [Ascoidea rubescens DSM 1968]ODV60538.1 hypothetical protein ASCRUDRAFT_35890 [Ascoidea rubescens DSM 1968]
MVTHIPAWKRSGLKIRSQLAEDPLSLPTSTFTTKAFSLNDTNSNNSIGAIDLDCKNNSKKRKINSINDDSPMGTPRKIPKKPKKPKNERDTPPVKDQLIYLRSFTNDKENWKFSKSKQNWIIKNILNENQIPMTNFDPFLFNYIKDLQGGSKIRILNEFKSKIDTWNKIIDNVDNQLDNDNDNDNDNNKDQDKNSKKEKRKKKQKTKFELEKEKPPNYQIMMKINQLLPIISDETILIKGLELFNNNNNNKNLNDSTEEMENSNKKTKKNKKIKNKDKDKDKELRASKKTQKLIKSLEIGQSEDSKEKEKSDKPDLENSENSENSEKIKKSKTKSKSKSKKSKKSKELIE